MLKLLLEIASPNELRSLFLMLKLPRQDVRVAGSAAADACKADAGRGAVRITAADGERPVRLGGGV